MPPDGVVFRLTIAMLLGALIGVERQWHHKVAGVKTHALVTVGAAAFALLSQLGLGPSSNPVQIAAGVVTGIGFIGGGVIMRRGASVQGINTAATLWASGGLGLAVGGGHYGVASALLVAVVVVELPLRWLSLWIDRHSRSLRTLDGYRLLVTFAPSAEQAVRTALADFSAARRAEVSDHGETRVGAAEVLLEARLRLPSDAAGAMRELSISLAALPGVSRAEWSRSLEDEHD
jgi:putative Mg2+ transporter-C (MgtC) family protein